MNISINEITSGVALRVDGQIWVVVDYQHVKPGKGSAFARVRIKNLKTGQVIERTFKSSESLEGVDLEERKLQNLYQSGDTYHFMDLTTYEETAIPLSILGDTVRFLQEQMEVKGFVFNNQVLKIELPTFIQAEIKNTDPGLKGDSSKSGTKPATIDTGATIQVPLFVGVGDRVKIDTRNGSYVERLKV